jgi:hypothetical protein
MRVTVLAAFAAVVGMGFSVAGQAPKDPPKEPPKSSAKDTPAAATTRAKLLKTPVTGNFKDVRLGDILKEFAAQVDMKGEQPVMWAYGAGFPYSQKFTFACKDTPLDAALDGLFAKVGKLGYVVVSKDGDKYDGWVWLTTGGERGWEKGNEPPPSAKEEADAAENLAIARKLIDGGKPAAAKPVLELLVKNAPRTKAGAEAKELLAKFEKM